MIGVDWGTTSFRAFRITPGGAIRDQRAGPRGIVNVPNNRFSDTLREEIGPWLAVGETHVLLSGMIGSRQGWKEAPYLPCPVGAREVAAGLVEIEFDWGQVKLVPGLSTEDEAGVAEVMRGAITRNSFLPWEFEILLDMEHCQIERRRRLEILRQYLRAVAKQMERGPGQPMKLSEFLARRALRHEAKAPDTPQFKLEVFGLF